MALNGKKISIAPGGPHADPKHETTYQASRGGWFPAPVKPVPGTPTTPKGGK